MEVNQKAATERAKRPFGGGYMWVSVCPTVLSLRSMDKVESVDGFGLLRALNYVHVPDAEAW